MEQNIGAVGLLLLVPIMLLFFIPFWKLWRRTGHGVLLSLLMTWLSIIGLIFLAFKKWPASESKG